MKKVQRTTNGHFVSTRADAKPARAGGRVPASTFDEYYANHPDPAARDWYAAKRDKAEPGFKAKQAKREYIDRLRGAQREKAAPVSNAKEAKRQYLERLRGPRSA